MPDNIKEGTKVPEINTTDITGNPFNISDYQGKKILLSFYRDVYCPFCNLRIHELLQMQDFFQKNGLVTISVFNSSGDEIQLQNEKRHFDLIAIADPEHKYYARFGIENHVRGKLRALTRLGKMMKFMAKGYFSLRSMTKENLIPADFLIDENQMVRKVHYGKDFGDHLDMDEIKAFAKS